MTAPMPDRLSDLQHAMRVIAEAVDGLPAECRDLAGNALLNVAAEAVGNSVTGYACSQCDGQMDVTNAQTNSGNVSATATTTIRGNGRSVATGANAIGNSATFYVSRPGT